MWRKTGSVALVILAPLYPKVGESDGTLTDGRRSAAGRVSPGRAFAGWHPWAPDV